MTFDKNNPDPKSTDFHKQCMETRDVPVIHSVLGICRVYHYTVLLRLSKI